MLSSIFVSVWTYLTFLFHHYHHWNHDVTIRTQRFLFLQPHPPTSFIVCLLAAFVWLSIVMLLTERTPSIPDGVLYYSTDQLLAFRNNILENNWISSYLMHHVRTLGINSIPVTIRGVRAGRNKQRPLSVRIAPRLSTTKNNKNIACIPRHCCLRNVPLTGFQHSARIVLLNAQSVCNKTELLETYILDNNLDVFIITETWVSSTNRVSLNAMTPLVMYVILCPGMAQEGELLSFPRFHLMHHCNPHKNFVALNVLNLL